MKNFLKDLTLAKKWSEATFNDLPWRSHRSFYSTLVSEVMLQQTTVSTVKARFGSFIQAYPDLLALSQAKDEDLLRLWQGLGYYNRAKRLKLAAGILAENKNYTLEQLQRAPGIGDYTANALLAIGLNQPALAIDVNLERVLLRYFGPNLITKTKYEKKNLSVFFEKKIKNKINNFRMFHEVIMDIGRTFCQARTRNCIQCPLKKGCESFKKNQDLFANVKVVKISKKSEVEIIRIMLLEKEKIYLVQRKKGQWLEGQWEVPSYVIKGQLDQKQYDFLKTFNGKISFEFKSTITHHHFINKVSTITKEGSNKFIKKGKWFHLNKLSQLPLTSVTHKILKKIKV